jgi:glycosyltransferase involved in cell wall biosynthesis
MPGVRTEVIFVEGGSTDDTAGEIRRVIDGYSGPLELRSYTQTGKGKGDAVRRGFAHATGDLLTILDADLTMPPEMLPRFYDAWSSGLGDFVSGNRLLYPMEGEAMRFLNTLGNVFFCKALAWILEAPLGDTLCGTKLLSRRDWNRVTRWRDDFGDFDPFGDFELLFSAAAMSLGIVEVPVHYRARTYGETNIHRFRHGLMLAKMSVIGLVRIRMGLGRSGKRR